MSAALHQRTASVPLLYSYPAANDPPSFQTRRFAAPAIPITLAARSRNVPSWKERFLATILAVHDRLATTMLLFMVIAGIWGLFSYVRGGTLSGNLAGTFLIGQGLIAVQVIAGILLYAWGYRAASSVHFLYGVTAILVLPFAWSYLRDRNPRHALMIYSLLALFIAGLAVRGMTTGR